MSLLGHWQTFALQKAMSAVSSKADMCGALANFYFGPESDFADFAQVFRSQNRSIWQAGLGEALGNPFLVGRIGERQPPHVL